MTEQIAIQNQLRNFLSQAQKRNPGYSLRAFAKKLQLSPSAVSEILNGKRKVSQKLAHKILLNLDCSPTEQYRILSLFNQDENSFTEGKDKLQSLQLSADQYHLISDWHHFAILSLAETKGFRADPLWIAKRLGVKVIEAELALERIQRLGLVRWSRKNKTLALTQTQITTSDEIKNQAIKKSHQQDLHLSAEALENAPIEIRDFTSMTMAVDALKIPQAKRMIRDFQAKMSAFLETGEQTEVYKLCVHLIPLSKEIT